MQHGSQYVMGARITQSGEACAGPRVGQQTELGLKWTEGPNLAPETLQAPVHFLDLLLRSCSSFDREPKGFADII